MKRAMYWLACAAATVVTGCGSARQDVNHPGPATVRVDRFWARAQEMVYKSPGELAAQDEAERQRGLAYRKLIRGNPDTKVVALTFDDGPHPRTTPALLDILKRNHVHATFFVVGMLAEKHPDLVRREVAEGHVVANHTYHHVNLNRIPADEVFTEWLACNEVLEAITHRPVRYCRPPGGDYDTTVINAAQAAGLTTVLWTDDPGDYASPGDQVIDVRTLKHVSNGGIILLHDGIQQTMDVLPAIIARLRREGYKFVTIDEMEHELRPQDRLRPIIPRSVSAAANPIGTRSTRFPPDAVTWMPWTNRGI